MKILEVLNPTLDDYRISGAALLGIHLGIELANQGNQVDFIANKDNLSDILRSEKAYDKVGILPEPEVSKGRSISDIIKYATDQYYERDYDVMHIHLHQMSVLANICKIVPKDCRVVYTQHTSTILGRFSLGYKDYAKELSVDKDRNVRLVMPSEAMLDIWKEYTELEDMSNVSVICNGVSTDYEFINNELVNDQLGRYIACGRLDPNKGTLDVAKVFAKAGLPITIIGDRSKGTLKESEADDKYAEDFERIVNESNNIKWVKQVDHNTLMSMFHNSKGFVSLSKKESSSLVTIEAMINRLPVFYLEEKAVEEVIENSRKCMSVAAIKVSRDSLYRKRESAKIDIMADKMSKFDEEINMVEGSAYLNSRRYEIHNFPYDMKVCAESYYNLYKSLLERKDDLNG